MIELVEVSPRDGLQNEKAILATSDKLELISRAITAGARRLEVVSFVNPALVPQMADAEAIVAGLLPRDDVRYIGLVLNQRGAERALRTGIHEIGVVCAASDAFGIRNQRQNSGESIAMARDVLGMAQAAGRVAHVTIAVAFGCPFDGRVDPEYVVDIARSLVAAGPKEIGLADTIGVARPSQAAALVGAVRRALPDMPIRGHFHDTRGMGIANSLAAIEAGATVLDTSVGGTGGCPFAPGAAGNVATEDIVYALGRDGECNLTRWLDTAAWLNQKLGRSAKSALMRAGPAYSPAMCASDFT